MRRLSATITINNAHAHEAGVYRSGGERHLQIFSIDPTSTDLSLFWEKSDPIKDRGSLSLINDFVFDQENREVRSRPAMKQKSSFLFLARYFVKKMLDCHVRFLDVFCSNSHQKKFPANSVKLFESSDSYSKLFHPRKNFSLT